METETDDEDVEEPSFGRPHHGENREAVSKSKDAQGRISLQVCNDLQVAIEVNPGTGWKVLYPEERFRLDTLQSVDVAARLRDDPDICGTCCVDTTALLRAKEAFGTSFGLAAVEFIEAEQREVEHERQFQEARFQERKVALLNGTDCANDSHFFHSAMVIVLFVLFLWVFFYTLDYFYIWEDLVGSAALVVLATCVFCGGTCINWTRLWLTKKQAAAEVKLLAGEIPRSYSHRCFVNFSYTVSVLLTASFVVFTVVYCIASPWFALIYFLGLLGYVGAASSGSVIYLSFFKRTRPTVKMKWKRLVGTASSSMAAFWTPIHGWDALHVWFRGQANMNPPGTC